MIWENLLIYANYFFIVLALFVTFCCLIIFVFSNKPAKEKFTYALIILGVLIGCSIIQTMFLNNGDKENEVVFPLFVTVVLIYLEFQVIAKLIEKEEIKNG